MSPRHRDSKFKGLNSESGILTVDFLFGMMVSLGLLTVFFVLAFSLSMVEVAQYIAFSSARAFAPAAATAEEQVANGNQKFNSLINKQAFQNLFASTEGKFFPLSGFQIKDGVSNGEFDSDYAGTSAIENRVPQTGVQFQIEFKLLSFNLPLLGSTSTDNDGYVSKITALLIREPSQQECLEQMRARYSLFQRLESDIPGRGEQDYNSVLTEDNGC